MKVTKTQLKQIIKEELERVLNEDHGEPRIIDTRPLVSAVVKNLVDVEEFEFEHPYRSLDDFGGAEFINWAKDHGIPVGPGRGSAPGSIVAWAHAEQDAVSSNYEIGYLPQDIRLPRQRYTLSADSGWYLIDYGIQSKYVHGPFANKEDARPYLEGLTL